MYINIYYLLGATCDSDGGGGLYNKYSMDILSKTMHFSSIRLIFYNYCNVLLAFFYLNAFKLRKLITAGKIYL